MCFAGKEFAFGVDSIFTVDIIATNCSYTATYYNYSPNTVNYSSYCYCDSLQCSLSICNRVGILINHSFALWFCGICLSWYRYTMSKSTALVFILFFGIILGLEQPVSLSVCVKMYVCVHVRTCMHCNKGELVLWCLMWLSYIMYWCLSFFLSLSLC